ncbi:sensor histidine kinase [Pseudomarimonas arenosa]|uniref:Signal transduction histidine-protein kinase/phosphatase MprB n=1 Tax=Pseudomarimonas arenosa TaxID=2774145 RepID=A0AAW3ZQS7_9GAMM|nr:HAMP domain-containing sensor histidine kinase [Pseudomarimonas arenosa]MBD8527839.1 HAMP domain-containing histidine kinase [Pseudomarimonas arenosa]
MSSSLIERGRALLWPPALAGRISRLLALGVLLLLGFSLFALRQLSLQSGSEQIADLVAAQIATLRALQATDSTLARRGQGSALVEVLVQDAPPAAASQPWLPFAKRLVERLQYRLGDGATVLLDEQYDRTWLWVSPATVDGQWLGLAVPPFRQQATLLSFVVLVAAVLLVVLGGIGLARLLTRPLRELAESAPAMVAGEIECAVLSAGAPTEVQQLAEALTRAGQQARAQARQRELMLAGLSHDLRTPLARLRYALAIEPPTDATLAQQVEDDLEELDALIGLFLDLGRGRPLRGANQQLDLAEFLSHWLPRFSERPWRLQVPSGLMVDAPSLLIRRLLGNLIRNAEHHASPPYLISAGRVAGRLLIDVIDAGHGIPSDQRQRLLQPFQRGTTQALGSGLGLAIAQDLAHLLGAELQLLDADPQGLCVRLLWPREDASD